MGVGCVNQNHNNFINKDTMDIKYDKSVSRLIVIRSSLQQLRTELIESGRVLKRLLKKPLSIGDGAIRTSRGWAVAHHFYPWITNCEKRDFSSDAISPKNWMRFSIIKVFVDGGEDFEGGLGVGEEPLLV